MCCINWAADNSCCRVKSRKQEQGVPAQLPLHLFTLPAHAAAFPTSSPRSTWLSGTVMPMVSSHPQTFTWASGKLG